MNQSLILGRSYLAVLFLIFGYTEAVRADPFNEPMTFNLATTGGTCSTCMWVAAQGVIQENTSQAFLEFLNERSLLDKSGVNIHLNSPGGSLDGGVKLGLAIRRQRANTVVAASRTAEVWDGGILHVRGDPVVDAQCSSACVFAFAGGVSRYASSTTPPQDIGFQRIGRIGVHQFYSPIMMQSPDTPLLSANDRIEDQKIITNLLSYLSKVDVSAELLQLAGETDPRHMHYLTEDELQRTLLDNRMVQKVLLKGYKNGTAIIEINFKRQDANYRLELYCHGREMRMLATIDWRGFYDVAGHRQWNFYQNLTLQDGTRVMLAADDFRVRDGGGVTGQFLFRFEGTPVSQIAAKKAFIFGGGSSSYAFDAARELSFTLPDDYNGGYVRPRTCL